MKSLIRVLVVFWYCQFVCCNILPEASLFELSNLFNPDELTKAYSNVFRNCDVKNVTQMFQSQMPFQHLYGHTLAGQIVAYTLRCDDKETKQELFIAFDEISSFFKNCIDPQYIQAVDDLHSAVLKMDNLLCTTNGEQFIEIAKITSDKSELTCYGDNIIQVASCIFSEKEITRLSKNVSQVIDFTAMLIGGNDNECGVVSRIEKCVQKTMTNCGDLLKVIGFTVKTMLELFDCKIIETTDLSPETTATAALRKLESIMKIWGLYIYNIYFLVKKLTVLLFNYFYSIANKVSKIFILWFI